MEDNTSIANDPSPAEIYNSIGNFRVWMKAQQELGNYYHPLYHFFRCCEIGNYDMAKLLLDCKVVNPHQEWPFTVGYEKGLKALTLANDNNHPTLASLITNHPIPTPPPTPPPSESSSPRDASDDSTPITASLSETSITPLTASPDSPIVKPRRPSVPPPKPTTPPPPKPSNPCPTAPPSNNGGPPPIPSGPCPTGPPTRKPSLTSKMARFSPPNSPTTPTRKGSCPPLPPPPPPPSHACPSSPLGTTKSSSPTEPHSARPAVKKRRNTDKRKSFNAGAARKTMKEMLNLPNNTPHNNKKTNSSYNTISSPRKKDNKRDEFSLCDSSSQDSFTQSDRSSLSSLFPAPSPTTSPSLSPTSSPSPSPLLSPSSALRSGETPFTLSGSAKGMRSNSPAFSRPTSFFAPSTLAPHKEVELDFASKLYVRTFLTFEDKIEDEKDLQSKEVLEDAFLSFQKVLLTCFDTSQIDSLKERKKQKPRTRGVYKTKLAKTTAPDLLASAFLDKDILFSSITNDPNFDFDEEDIPYYDAMFEEKKQETENEKEENGDGNEEVKEKRKEVGWGEVFGAFVGACEELTSKCFVLLLSSFEEKLLFSLRDPERGFSLPHVVASMGKKRILKEMISLGYPMDVHDKKGWLPIHHLLAWGKKVTNIQEGEGEKRGVEEELISLVGDFDCVVEEMWEERDWAIKKKKWGGKEGDSLLHFVVQGGHRGLAGYVASHCSILANKEGKTALDDVLALEGDDTIFTMLEEIIKKIDNDKLNTFAVPLQENAVKLNQKRVLDFLVRKLMGRLDTVYNIDGITEKGPSNVHSIPKDSLINLMLEPETDKQLLSSLFSCRSYWASPADLLSHFMGNIQGENGVNGVCRALHVWYELVPRDFNSSEMQKMMPNLLQLLESTSTGSTALSQWKITWQEIQRKKILHKCLNDLPFFQKGFEGGEAVTAITVEMLGKGGKGGKGNLGREEVKEEGKDDYLNVVGNHLFAFCFQIQQGIALSDVANVPFSSVSAKPSKNDPPPKPEKQGSSGKFPTAAPPRSPKKEGPPSLPSSPAPTSPTFSSGLSPSHTAPVHCSSSGAPIPFSHSGPVPFSSSSPSPSSPSRFSVDDNHLLCPLIDLYNDFLNDIVRWVGIVILSFPDAPGRARAIEGFIKLLNVCWEMKNYYLALGISLAMTDPSIDRLSDTWGLVDQNLASELKSYHQIVSPSKNFADFRAVISSCSSPAVAYLGIPFRDLIYLHEVNKSYVGPNLRSVNVLKMKDIHNIIQDWQVRIGENPPSFSCDPALARGILSIIGCGAMFSADLMYTLSKRVENPRHSKKQKNTNLVEIKNPSLTVKQMLRLTTLLPHFTSSSYLTNIAPPNPTSMGAPTQSVVLGAAERSNIHEVNLEKPLKESKSSGRESLVSSVGSAKRTRILPKKIKVKVKEVRADKDKDRD